MEETYQIDGEAYAIGHTREYVKIACPMTENCNLENKFVRGRVKSKLKDHILLVENVTIENID